ncbi:MAG: transposase [Dehalococcoidia bacterium]
MRTPTPRRSFHVVIHATAVTRPFEALSVADGLWNIVCNELERPSVRLLCATLMPDHLHLVVSPRKKPITDWVRDFKAFSTDALRPLHGRDSIWQARFYDYRLRSEEELGACVEYVCRNALDAGLVDEPGEWPWVGSWLDLP